VNRSAQAVQIAIAGTIEIHSTTRSRRGKLPLGSMFSPRLTMDFQLGCYIIGVITRMISPELHGVKSESRPYLLNKISPANLAVHNRREGFNSLFPGGVCVLRTSEQVSPGSKARVYRMERTGSS
jgi:hypothetical protein